MNVRLRRRRGQRCTFLEIGARYRGRLRQLTTEAESILASQDQALWSRAGGPDFLERILAGVLILEGISNDTAGSVILEDDSAHLAFMAVCALALVASHLGQRFTQTLHETLELVAMCCPVDLELLPHLHSLPSQLRAKPEIRRLLQGLSNGPREVTLADALYLFHEFKKLSVPQFSAALSELDEVTEGFRTARNNLRGAHLGS